MAKVLFVSNTANFSKFNLPLMEDFQNRGWVVHYLSPNDESVSRYCDRHIVVPMRRSPLGTLLDPAIFLRTRRLMVKERYDLIHCHTPVGSVVARIANFLGKRATLIYTAHGFHFFLGSPLKNWVLYFPIEFVLAFVTDCLITINSEDFGLAQGLHFPSKKIVKIDGVGIDLSRFTRVASNDRADARRRLGITDDRFVILYVAEFIERKNHKLLLNNLTELTRRVPGSQVVLVGTGELLSHMKERYASLVDIGVLSFLGYQRNMPQFYQLSDVVVSTSKQEGLPAALLEALACGLPIVCSDIRGHRDIVVDGRNGFLFPLGDAETMISGISALYRDNSLRAEIRKNNLIDSKKFAVGTVVGQVRRIYDRLRGLH